MHKTQNILNRIRGTALTVLAGFMTASTAQAQYTAVWYDSFNTSVSAQTPKFEFNSPTREAFVAPLTYINYLQNPAGPDYHHQLTGGAGGQLLMAGDTIVQFPTVSPNYNFKGPILGSQIIGKKISFSLNLNATTSAAYTAAGISLGASAGLGLMDDASTHFGVKFVEDGAFGSGNFIQFYDGINLVNNLLPFTAGGAGAFGVELLINDLSDGNPWDGVGSTTIDLYVNSVFIAGYTKGGGGYTDNFLSLEGERGFTSPTLTIATHTFDDLTVYAAPVPEPSALALIGLGVAGIFAGRRQKK